MSKSTHPFMATNEFMKYLKKFWTFLWDEDSVLSWIVNIVLAFVIIKFVVYPGLGFALGTSLPVVAVISESMEHDDGFDAWWGSQAYCGEETILTGEQAPCTQKEWYAEKGITEEDFRKFHMHNGFSKGDIIILRGQDYEDIKVGDIIVFQSKLAYPIIHRVVEKNDVIQTKGDHNAKQIVDGKLNEKSVTQDQVIGTAWLKIPWLGYIKIWFVDLIRCIALQGCNFG
jgi:signal peptidase I